MRKKHRAPPLAFKQKNGTHSALTAKLLIIHARFLPASDYNYVFLQEINDRPNSETSALKR